MPRINFSLRTLLVIPAVFAACIALNLRPTYPNAPTEMTTISGSELFVVLMREYGWPCGCVHADLKPGWDASDGGIVWAPVYQVGDVFWQPLCANIAVPIVICMVLISGMSWRAGRLHNMVFTQGPLLLGESFDHEHHSLR